MIHIWLIEKEPDLEYKFQYENDPVRLVKVRFALAFDFLGNDRRMAWITKVRHACFIGPAGREQVYVAADRM